MEEIWGQFLTWLSGLVPKVIAAGVILAVGFWAARLLYRVILRGMERSKADATFVSFFGSCIRVALKAIVVITAIAQFVDVSSIIATVAAAGVTVGLAMKENLSGIASGAQIIFTRPFRVGDYVAIEGNEGTVERIEMMFTALRTFDNKEIIIPNSEVIASTVVNVSAMQTRRLDLTFTVSYGADLDRAKAVLRALVEAHPLACKDPEPLVAVSELRDSSVALVVKVWCAKDDYWTLYYDMQENVKKKFDEEGIVIPFPQMDVHLQNGAPQPPSPPDRTRR